MITTSGSRPGERLLVGAAGALLMLHGAGWAAAAIVFWQQATLRVPRIQSAIAIGLALLVLRASSATRRRRRLVVLCVLVIAAVAFATVPLPQRFDGESMSGADVSSSRGSFDSRFGVPQGDVNFHSHLGDVVMSALDGAFGRSETSPLRAYETLAMLAGLLFLLELGIAAAWHRWSRQSCRYVGLALATPWCLLLFGYWDLGYLSVAAGVVPLLILAGGRRSAGGDVALLSAGFLQGLHAALHGFGLLGMAAGALAAFGRRGDALRRCIRAATFTSAAVALYLGWVFFYVTNGLSIVWARRIGYRPLSESVVFDERLANPLLSLAGFGEFGLFSALSGVPILALAMVTCRRPALVPAILYSLPGLFFLVRWWPDSAPFNLDLLLSAFPGIFAACWAVASSRRSSTWALLVFAGLHALLWTTTGNGMFARTYIER